ncbi:MAG TPA: NAD(P)-dependent oxidoreductase [Hyphomicrobiaceae bacterium]|nr:NAD(P)-dependent oxidoreductase [Hyphomicrobiaceae bacterium]
MEETSMQLGYVGLGNMGAALARRLLRKDKMRVYDLRPETMARLADQGGIASQSPKALAAQSDMVMTCLPTSREVREVIFGADGLAAGLKKGGIIADMTTGDPNATRAMAKELAKSGITLIDAPVSGGPHGADAGTIAIMVGAPADIYARVEPVFQTISPNVFHCGDVGTGHTMKLVNNVIAASVRMATFEAVTMGIKNGLSLETCARVLAKGSARSYTTEITLPKFVKGELKTNFTLELMHKDVRLATELGVASASPMPVCNLVREVFQMAVNELGGPSDVNALIHMYERQSKVEFAPKA